MRLCKSHVHHFSMSTDFTNDVYWLYSFKREFSQLLKLLGIEDVAQWVEELSSMHEVLSWNPGTT